MPTTYIVQTNMGFRLEVEAEGMDVDGENAAFIDADGQNIVVLPANSVCFIGVKDTFKEVDHG